jgi:hypothetical protein
VFIKRGTPVHDLRKYCDHEKIYQKFSIDLHTIRIAEYEKVVAGMPSICVCASLAFELLDRLYLYYAFKSSPIINQCPEKMTS